MIIVTQSHILSENKNGYSSLMGTIRIVVVCTAVYIASVKYTNPVYHLV